MYRGRGAIQLTGKDNYSRFARDFGLSLPETVTFLTSIRGAIISAGWYWQGSNLNVLADAGQIKEQTKKINGGYNGLEERLHFYNAFLHVI
jgi:putative chitinase